MSKTAQPVSMMRKPVREHIVTDAKETFLLRCDDYPWERNVWNVHPEYEIHLVRNASGVALIGDHVEPFESGYLCIVGSGLPHDWVTPIAPGERIPQRDIVLQFDADRVLAVAENLPELEALRPFLQAALRGLAFHGKARARGGRLMEAMLGVTGLHRLTLFLELLRVLSENGEFKVLSSLDFAPNTDDTTMDRLQDVLRFIRANFRREIRLPELSERLGMSESAFSRFFKKNSGNSFTEYVTMLRIGFSCQMLAETDVPVTEICFESGFTNVSNFNRLFRSQRGLTPSRYRHFSRQKVAHRSTEQRIAMPDCPED